MRFRTGSLTAVLLGCSLLCAARAALAQENRQPHAHTFAIAGKQFLLDGKPFHIISGEMHYTRVPRAYWRQRFREARHPPLGSPCCPCFCR